MTAYATNSGHFSFLENDQKRLRNLTTYLNPVGGRLGRKFPRQVYSLARIKSREPRTYFHEWLIWVHNGCSSLKSVAISKRLQYKWFYRMLWPTYTEQLWAGIHGPDQWSVTIYWKQRCAKGPHMRKSKKKERQRKTLVKPSGARICGRSTIVTFGYTYKIFIATFIR